MSKLKLITMFILVLILGITWLGYDSREKFDESKLVEVKSTHSSEYKFTLDEVISYELLFKQYSVLYLDKRAPLPQEFELKAHLNIKPIEKKDGTLWTLVQLSQIEFHNSVAKPILTQRLQELYSQMFLVLFSTDGEILEVKFPGLEENYSSLKQTMFLMQMVNRNYAYYELNELDTNGEYKAEYRKKNRALEKKILHYYDDANEQNFIVLESNSSALIDTKGAWLSSLNLHQKLKNRTGEFENSNELTLKKIPTVVDKSLDIFLNRDSVSKLFKSFEKKIQKDVNIWDEIKEQEDKKLIQKSNITLDAIMKKIVKKPKDSNTYLLLSKYLKANPDAVFELVEKFEEYDDYVQMHIIGVMEYISTPESEKALSQLAVSDTVNEENQVRAIVSIGSLSKPSKESVETLNRVIEEGAYSQENDKKNTAILALGTLKNRVVADEIVEEIKELFRADETISGRRVILYSIQNAGVDSFVEEVQKELNSKSKKNRILALETLSQMKDRDALTIILKNQLKVETSKKIVLKIEEMLGNGE